MKRFWNMYRVEQRIFFRSPDVILFCLAMPLVAFAIIAMIAGGKPAADSGLTYLQSAYVALSTVGICCSAFMSIPITIVELRSQGILRRMYCSPCSPARLLACDTLCSAVIAALSTLLLTVAAVAFSGYRMQGSALLYVAAWLLTMVSMFSIGLMAASLCRTTKSMNVATSLLYFPMLLFSGATIPAEVFPAGLQGRGHPGGNLRVRFRDPGRNRRAALQDPARDSGHLRLPQGILPHIPGILRSRAALH